MTCQECQHHFFMPELELGCRQGYYMMSMLGANTVLIGPPRYLDGGAETCPGWSEQKLGGVTSCQSES